jgi:hypothetical protein
MEWPKDIVDLFDKALKIEPSEGLDKLTVLKALFDETVRRALQRVNGDPRLAGAALRSPYTPLGSVIGEGIMGMARSLSLGGTIWGEAVDSLHQYIEDNAETVFAAFEGQGKEYRDHGFGPLLRQQSNNANP